MKRFITICVLLIVLVGASIWESFYISHEFDFLEEEIFKIMKQLEDTKDHIDTEENEELISSLHTKWHKKTEFLKALVWHSGIKDVEVGLSRALTYTKENNYTEAIVELQGIIDFAYHYENDFEVSFDNIF